MSIFKQDLHVLTRKWRRGKMETEESFPTVRHGAIVLNTKTCQIKIVGLVIFWGGKLVYSISSHFWIRLSRLETFSEKKKKKISYRSLNIHISRQVRNKVYTKTYSNSLTFILLFMYGTVSFDTSCKVCSPTRLENAPEKNALISSIKFATTQQFLDQTAKV